MRRIDRHVGRPGLEHRQHRHDRVRAPREQHRHVVAGTHPMTGKQMRQPVGGLIELCVRQRLRPECHRHVLGRPLHMFGEQFRNRNRCRHRLSQRRPVAPLVELDCSSPISKSSDDSGRSGSVAIATTICCSRSARSATSKFANGCPRPLCSGRARRRRRGRTGRNARRAVIGVGRRCLGTAEVQREPGRDEVDGHPIRCLPRAGQASTFQACAPENADAAAVLASARRRVGRTRRRSDPVEHSSTSGTTPASIAGSVFDSGATRLLTGKSSATSEPKQTTPAPRERMRRSSPSNGGCADSSTTS